MLMFDNVARPFKLLISAFRNCWEQIWKSVFVLAVITMLLATVFYIVESPLQEEYSNWFQDVLWAFCVYIQDPGGLGGNGPITVTGKVIATILGVLNILIVAVPAGIIAGGFTTALEDEAREKKLAKDSLRIRDSFKPVQCRHTFLKVIPSYQSLMSLQVRLGMTADDIIEAVNGSACDDMRLRNIADTYPSGSVANDNLIVECFPTACVVNDTAQEKREYGCLIDRGSNVTIVCPSSHALDEIGDSRFGYLLAEFGGFNFISREFDLDNDMSYYLPGEGATDSEPVFKEFYSDLRRLAEGDDKWVIFIMQVPRELSAQINIVSEKKIDGKVSSTILPGNEAEFKSVVEAMEKMLAKSGDTANGGYKVAESEQETDAADRFKVDLNRNFKPVGKRNITSLLGAGDTTNAFTLRIASKLIARDRRAVPIALRMAEILRTSFVGKDSYFTANTPRWKKGIKYSD